MSEQVDLGVVAERVGMTRTGALVMVKRAMGADKQQQRGGAAKADVIVALDEGLAEKAVAAAREWMAFMERGFDLVRESDKVTAKALMEFLREGPQPVVEVERFLLNMPNMTRASVRRIRESIDCAIWARKGVWPPVWMVERPFWMTRAGA